MMSWRFFGNQFSTEESLNECQRCCIQTQFQREKAQRGRKFCLQLQTALFHFKIPTTGKRKSISLNHLQPTEVCRSFSFLSWYCVSSMLPLFTPPVKRRMPPPLRPCSRSPVAILLFSLFFFKYNASQYHYDHLTF